MKRKKENPLQHWLKTRWSSGSIAQRLFVTLLLTLGIFFVLFTLIYFIALLSKLRNQPASDSRLNLPCMDSEFSPASSSSSYATTALALTGGLTASNKPLDGIQYPFDVEKIMSEMNDHEIDGIIAYYGECQRTEELLQERRGNPGWLVNYTKEITQSLEDEIKPILRDVKLNKVEQAEVQKSINYISWLKRCLRVAKIALEINGGHCDELTSVAVLSITESAHANNRCINMLHTGVFYTHTIHNVWDHVFLLIDTSGDNLQLTSLTDIPEDERKYFLIVDPWAGTTVSLETALNHPSENTLYVGSHISNFIMLNELTCPNRNALCKIDQTYNLNLISFFDNQTKMIMEEFHQAVVTNALSYSA